LDCWSVRTIDIYCRPLGTYKHYVPTTFGISEQLLGLVGEGRIFSGTITVVVGILNQADTL